MLGERAAAAVVGVYTHAPINDTALPGDARTFWMFHVNTKTVLTFPDRLDTYERVRSGYGNSNILLALSVHTSYVPSMYRGLYYMVLVALNFLFSI